MARHVKKGDMVQVITGDNKGSSGKVLRVMPEKGRIIVEGVNRKYKHVKPSRKYPQGGTISYRRNTSI